MIWLSLTIFERNTSTESSMGMGPGSSQLVEDCDSSLNPVMPEMSQSEDCSTEVSSSREDGGMEDSSRVSEGDGEVLGGERMCVRKTQLQR